MVGPWSPVDPQEDHLSGALEDQAHEEDLVSDSENAYKDNPVSDSPGTEEPFLSSQEHPSSVDGPSVGGRAAEALLLTFSSPPSPEPAAPQGQGSGQEVLRSESKNELEFGPKDTSEADDEAATSGELYDQQSQSSPVLQAPSLPAPASPRSPSLSDELEGYGNLSDNGDIYEALPEATASGVDDSSSGFSFSEERSNSDKRDKEPPNQPRSMPDKQDSPRLQVPPLPALASRKCLSLSEETKRVDELHDDDNSETSPETKNSPQDDLFAHSFFAQQKFDERPANEVLRQPRQSTPDWLVGGHGIPLEQEEEPESGTYSPRACPFDLGSSPMRDDADAQYKANRQTQVPSQTVSNASQRTGIRNEPSTSSRQKTPGDDKWELPWPPSPEGGQQASAPMALPQNPPAPVFITRVDADDANFAPYLEEEKPGDSQADTMARDQIRRSQAILGDRLTEEAKEVIRQYYREMGQRRRTEEVSQPRTIHPPTPSLESGNSPGSSNVASNSSSSSSSINLAGGQHSSPTAGPSASQTTDDVAAETLNETANRLRHKIEALEARVSEVEKQRASEQQQLDSAWADIAQLKRDREIFEEKLAALEEELKTARTDLGEHKADTTRKEGACDTSRLESKCADLPQTRLCKSGCFSSTAVVIAMAALVWLVTEAMLHSKRLSDGYGPFVNGGYNGLGSVVIFGTWIKFLLFSMTVVFLGVFSVLAALGL